MDLPTQRRLVDSNLSHTLVAALLRVQGVTSLVGIVLTLVYLAECFVIAPVDAPVSGVLMLCGCLVPQVALASRARALAEPSPRLAFAFALASALAVVGAHGFFHGPAHDVALWFGSHGRFGCTTVDELGNRTTWLDDRTLPWLLSLPIPLTWTFWSGLRPSPHRARC